MNRNFFRTCSMAGALALLAACGENAVGPNGALSPKGPSFNASVPFNNNGVCMADDAVAAPTGTVPGVKQGDDPLTATNCTSNDVNIATTNLISYRLADEDGNFSGTPILYTGQNVACVENQGVELTLSAELDETATSERFDIGVWIATDGGNAITGACNHYNLVEGGTVTDEDGDSCGDLNEGANVTGFELGTITTICQVNPDPEAEDTGLLHVGSCLGWTEPGANRICPVASTDDGAGGFRWGTLYGNKAKCNCDGFDVDITVLQSAFLEIQKVCVPTSDAGLFNLQIDGTTEATDAACIGGTTGKKTVGAGDSDNPGASHTFGETAGTATSLSDYTSTRECHDRGGSAGDVLIAGSGTGGTVDLDPNDDVICTITNTRNTGTIELKKVWVGPGGQTTLNIGTTAGGSEVKSQLTGAAGAAPLTTGAQSVNTGTYYVSETGGLTDYASSLACTDNGTPITPGGSNSVTLATGHAIVCTFTNSRKPALTVSKIFAGGTMAFSFSRTGISNFTLQNGQSNSSGFTLTPGVYTVCELNNAVSFNATATLDGSPVSLLNPGALLQPPEDLGNRCYDVTLAYGDDKTIVFTNTQPPTGGDARTIGYWKNWSTCTGGNQIKTATKNGLLSKTLDPNLPITIGLLNVDECWEAVAILDKRDLSGNKKASDAAYNMAAQLLAAMLNQKAGAADACNIDQLIIDANALLVQLNFNGTGSYLGKGANATLIAKANNYATLLDKYNNNVCVNYVP